MTTQTVAALSVPPSAVPPADLLPVGRRPTYAYRLARAVIRPILRLLFRFRVEGLENAPRDKPYVLIANHLNWLDSFAILYAFPAEPRIHFLGDPTVLVQRRFQWNVIRRIGGYISVDRSRHNDPALFRHVDRCLEAGGVVALYPESEYGATEGGILPFKKGFAHFALQHKVPILPVALSGTKDLWWGKRIRVVVGQPIDTGGHSVPSLVASARDTLAALLPEYRESRAPKLFRHRLTTLF